MAYSLDGKATSLDSKIVEVKHLNEGVMFDFPWRKYRVKIEKPMGGQSLAGSNLW